MLLNYTQCRRNVCKKHYITSIQSKIANVMPARKMKPINIFVIKGVPLEFLQNHLRLLPWPACRRTLQLVMSERGTRPTIWDMRQYWKCIQGHTQWFLWVDVQRFNWDCVSHHYVFCWQLYKWKNTWRSETWFLCIKLSSTE